MFLTWRAARLHRFVFLFFAALASYSLYAKISCSIVLTAATADPLHSQVFGTRETWLREEVIPEIQAHSRGIERNIRRFNNAGNSAHYDYVIIGSGPHGAQMALSLKQTDPKARVLIIEGKDAPGVFAQYSGSFSINTGRDGTNISGGAVTADQMANTQNRYLSARTIGNLTWISHHVADSDLIFNAQVPDKGIKRLNPGKEPPEYEIRTANGLKVTGANVIIATGLGEPTIRLADAESQAVVNQLQTEKDQNGIGKVTVVDDLLPSLSRHAETKRHSAVNDMKDEEVLVVGAGDGGRIAAQALAGLSDPLNRTLGREDSVKKVILMGERAKTPEEFEDHLAQQGKKARYGVIAKGMESGTIETLGFKLTRVEKDKESGRIRVYWKDEGGKENTRLVDRIVFATGYNNKAEALFDSGTKETVTSVEVKQDMSGCTNFNECRGMQVVGNQLHTGEKAEGVYLAGNASTVYPSASQWDEAKNLNEGGFLAMLSERTRVLALGLGKTNRQRPEARTLVLSEPKPVTMLIEKHGNSPNIDLSAELSEVVFRTELNRALLGVNIAGDLEHVNSVTLTVKETDLGIHLSTINVADQSIIRPLASNPRFIRAVEDYAKGNLVAGAEAKITIPIQLIDQSTTEGVLNFANSKISLAKSYTGTVPDVTVNPDALFAMRLKEHVDVSIRELPVDAEQLPKKIYTYFNRYGEPTSTSYSPLQTVPRNTAYMVESTKEDMDYNHNVISVKLTLGTHHMSNPLSTDLK